MSTPQQEPTSPDRPGQPASGETRSGTPANAAKNRRWKKIRFGLMLGVGVLLIVVMLWSTDRKQVGESLQHASYTWLILGILGNLVTPFLRSERFRTLYEIPGRRVEITGGLAQNGLLNTILPLQAGDIVFLSILKKRGAISSIAEALPRWILLRMGDTFALLCLVLLTALFVPVHASFQGFLTFARWSVGAFCLGGLLAIILLRRLSPAAEHSPQGMIASKLWALRRGLNDLHRPGILAKTLLWSLIIWVWHTSLLALQYGAFRLGLPPEQLWAVAVALLTTSILPIHAPMGIGTLHAVQVGLLKLFGIAEAPALAAAIGIHAGMMITVLLQGAIGFTMLARTAPPALELDLNRQAS